MKLPSLPNLEGLIRLAREDRVDVRPTLLRVLADMYVQKLGHSRDEERRFVELASWLLTSADVETRATIARKFANYPQGPRAIVRRLAADVFEVAEPMLRYSSCLTAEDLLEIAIECGARHAAAIAARDETLGAATSPTTSVEVSAPESADPIAEKLELDAVARAYASIAEMPATVHETHGAVFEPVSDGLRFLRGSADERREVLEALAEQAPASDTQPALEPDRESIARLETAARRERPEEFARILQQVLRLPPRVCRDIVDDDRGEPVVIAARALGVPGDVLLRILLFLNPHIGQSVERVFALVDLYRRIPAQAALRLVSDWRARPAARGAGYQSLHWDDETRARRPAADQAWRSGRQQPDAGAEPKPASGRSELERRHRTT